MAPVRYPSIKLCYDTLQMKMKCPPLPVPPGRAAENEQVVAEIDRVELRIALSVRRRPPLGRMVFAVLLFLLILPDDQFRFQQDDLSCPCAGSITVSIR